MSSNAAQRPRTPATPLRQREASRESRKVSSFRWDPKKRKFVLMKVDSETGLAVKRRRGTESREEKT